jgi:cell division protein FtsB
MEIQRYTLVENPRLMEYSKGECYLVTDVDPILAALEAAVMEKDEQLLNNALIHDEERKDLKRQIATLSAENKKIKKCWEYKATMELEAENERLRNGLDAILPMAKGYAAEHNVGRNQEIVNEVVALNQTESGGENDSD